MKLPDDFTFSQSSLQDYVDCPRRFELRYILRQRWPAPEVDDLLEFERRMEQGDRFHHLVHQHLVGIPPEILQRQIQDADVRRWFEAYLQTGLEGLPEMRRPEVTLTVPLGEVALLAKFDLLAVEPGGRAVIMDWKTDQNIPRAETLAKRMQTIVYRYALAAGGDHFNDGQPIPPERIEMVYWYADHNGGTRRFPYDAAQFALDAAVLTGLVEQITARQDFPLTDDETRCRYCVYRSLCNRGTEAGSLAAWGDFEYDERNLNDFTIALDQIAEIEF